MHQVLKQRPALPAPQPRSRRDRRARREPAIVRHLVMPGLEVARAAARPRETVTAFLRRTGWATRDRKYGWQFRKGLPTILEIDGEAVLRRDWRRSRARVDEISKKLDLMKEASIEQSLELRTQQRTLADHEARVRVLEAAGRVAQPIMRP
jgi:hypothetical protein